MERMQDKVMCNLNNPIAYASVVKIFAYGPKSQFSADIEVDMIFRANVHSALAGMSAPKKNYLG